MGTEISLEQFDLIIAANKSCLVLNSRQSRRPCARDPWVQATSRAITSLQSDEPIFLNSIGQNTWEIAIHLVNRVGGRQIVVLPRQLEDYGFSSPEAVIAAFHLNTDRTSILTLDCANPTLWQNARDDFVVSHAGVLVPVSLRADGNMARLLAANFAKVDASYRIGYPKTPDTIRYDWNAAKLNPAGFDEWDFLTHWTRSAQGPFPGQDQFDHYDAVLNSSDYPSSAFHSLRRILGEGRIRSSDRFIRGAFPVVSLTALPPNEALRLMRWRRRYGSYSFEPYGIAIRKSFAAESGFREVRYGVDEDYEAMNAKDRPFFQKVGSEVADWRPEAEWRHLGDIDLSLVPIEHLRVITYQPVEAELLRAAYPYEVFSILNE